MTMADGANDEDIRKFEEENKEMIDRIIAKRKAEEEAADRARFEEMRGRIEEQERRASADERYRATMAREAEEEQRRTAYDDAADRAYSAFGDARDRAADFARDQEEYAYRRSREARDRIRDRYADERRYAFDAADEARANIRDDVDRIRRYANEDMERVFSPFTDPKFQQHLVGAGLEAWMALNSLLRSSNAPEFMKDFADSADRSKNIEYCRKNEYCRSKRNPDAPRYREESGNGRTESERPAGGPTPISINITDTSGKKEKDGESKEE